ncbi:MAG: hypothetical protein OEY14_01700 [Myxococcales bacterium]|nr:hypothetical protein [Myxococcales bacterium]
MTRSGLPLLLLAGLLSPAPLLAQPPADGISPPEPTGASEGSEGSGGDAPAGASGGSAVSEASGTSGQGGGDAAAIPEGEASALDETGEEGGAAATPTERPPYTPVSRSPGAAEGRASSAGDGTIPVRIALHGSYRARYSMVAGLPVLEREYTAQRANFGFMRLRLEPQITYGTREDAPIAALRMQLDGLDNVVMGDNARLSATPLFAGDPSYTDLDGFELRDTIRLERAWLEFLIPIGQIRVGRMPSHWGLGILAHDGNGLGEWGDPSVGATFDRLLFATRPLTVFNALSRGDARQTPLIYAIAYDKLVEHPIRPDLPDVFGGHGPIRVGPLSSRFEERPGVPFAFLSGDGDDVNELVNALVWKDPDFQLVRDSDELNFGVYHIYRWQTGQRTSAMPAGIELPRSRIHIVDAWWKLRVGLGRRLPTLYTEGEILTIQGTTNTVSLAGGCDDEWGVCDSTDANIWGAVVRAGLEDANEAWKAQLEWGLASGDGKYFGSDELSARALHPDYRVGLLTYQVALNALTANGLGEAIRPLWSRGGVWNSHYLYPQARITLLPGVEVHGALLLSWARELNATVFASERSLLADSSCGFFDSDCFIGTEIDLALRLRWGPNDLMSWDTELGLMYAGEALLDDDMNSFNGLDERLLWTLQTRAAMQF